MFRRLDPEAREDAVQEMIANACVAFARLVQQDKADQAYASALARFAVAQFRDGRRVGNRQSIRDVLSPCAKKQRRREVERLDRFEELAIGHSTGDVAKRFGLTPGRISQMRRELHQSWEEFHQGSPEDRTISEDA